MATIDLKLKTYEQLQFEVMRLNTDNYLKQQELDQYKNNWEELKKMFEADEHFEDGCYCSEILSKMKELEESKNGR
jgi:hypothetical protein